MRPEAALFSWLKKLLLTLHISCATYQMTPFGECVMRPRADRAMLRLAHFHVVAVYYEPHVKSECCKNTHSYVMCRYIFLLFFLLEKAGRTDFE